VTRILVFSDVHANLPALEAVLKDAGTLDEFWCLGDVVGYGPDPNECISIIRDLPNLICMMGNHDLAAIGNMPLDIFNSDARSSLLWQKEKLSTESLDFLKKCPQELQVRGEVSLVHGSPRDPVWEYIFNTMIAYFNLEYFTTPWCFVGHSHFQAIFQYNPEDDQISIEIPEPGLSYSLKERAILNPGSVGQPRDRDTCAAYAIFDSLERTWQPKRVKYDFHEVQERILKAGLPARHAERLSGGW
jgi:diadenosine tetraphosphatase ApaH/serine/threonine PP2A family protein phosphatase